MDDPYRAPEVPADMPASDLPQATERTTRQAMMSPAFWLPIAIALAFVIAMAYSHFVHTNAAPNMHAATLVVPTA